LLNKAFLFFLYSFYLNKWSPPQRLFFECEIKLRICGRLFFIVSGKIKFDRLCYWKTLLQSLSFNNSVGLAKNSFEICSVIYILQVTSKSISLLNTFIFYTHICISEVFIKQLRIGVRSYFKVIDWRSNFASLFKMRLIEFILDLIAFSLSLFFRTCVNFFIDLINWFLGIKLRIFSHNLEIVFVNCTFSLRPEISRFSFIFSLQVKLSVLALTLKLFAC